MKKAKIDKLGRIVIPINHRNALNITEETEIIVEYSKNKITITPSVIRCKICEKEIGSSRPLPICNDCIHKIKNLD